MTILELYCNFKSWQGGTIHQVREDFLTLSADDKTEFLELLYNNRDSLLLHAVGDVQWFINNA